MIQVNKFIKNSAYSLISGAVSTCSAFFLPIILVRFMPKSEYSIWVLLLQVGGYLSYLNVGLQTGITRFTAINESDSKIVRGYVSSGFFLLLAIAVAGWLSLVIFSRAFSGFDGVLPNDYRRAVFYEIMPWICLAYASILPVNAIFGFYIGIRSNVQNLINNSILKTSIFCFVLAAAASGLSLQGMSYSLVAAYGLSLLHVAYLVVRNVNGLNISWRYFDSGKIKELVGYSWAAIFWSLSMFLITSASSLIVAKFDFDELGGYVLISGAASLLVNLFLAVFSNLMPEYARMENSTSNVEKGVSILNATKVSAVAIGVIWCGLLYIPDELFATWLFKTKSDNSIILFYAVVYSAMHRLLALPYSMHLLATNQQRLGIYTALSEGVVNLSVSFFAALKFGVLGVSFGMIAGMIWGLCANILFNFRRDKKISINSSAYFRCVFLRGLLPSLMVFFFSIFLRKHLHANFLLFIWATPVSIFIFILLAVDANSMRIVNQKLKALYFNMLGSR